MTKRNKIKADPPILPNTAQTHENKDSSLKHKYLETPPSPSSPSCPSPPSSPSPTLGVLLRLVLRLGRIIHQQRIQGQAIWKDEIADRRTTDVDGIEGDGFTALNCHFNGAQRGVHLR